MKQKHTEGPWSVSAGNEIRKAEGVPMLLATVNNSEGAKINGYDAEANARLMAAAPELLEALDDLVFYLGDMWQNDDFIIAAKKAIDKATDTPYYNG
jgi:hypothetical protein